MSSWIFGPCISPIKEAFRYICDNYEDWLLEDVERLRSLVSRSGKETVELVERLASTQATRTRHSANLSRRLS